MVLQLLRPVLVVLRKIRRCLSNIRSGWTGFSGTSVVETGFSGTSVKFAIVSVTLDLVETGFSGIQLLRPVFMVLP